MIRRLDGRFGRMLRTAAMSAALLTIPAWAGAASSDLAAFLERAEKMAEFTRPSRADIRIMRDGELAETAVLIVDPSSGRQFFALKSSQWRALLPLRWGDGKVVASEGARPVAFSVDTPIPATDLRAMEFFAFWETDYATAFISDSNRLEKTITLYARQGTPYVLFVITFDKAKLVPLAIKYYKDNMNNLVRLRRDSDFVMVGSRPRPQSIEIRDFTENTTTTFEISWRLLDSVPAGLTDEASFYKVALDWPGDPIAAR